MQSCAPLWLEQEKAADIGVATQLSQTHMEALRSLLHAGAVDVFCTKIDGREKKLLLADMDSTIVHGECIDDLADFVGLREKVADITARAMDGEIDFRTALEERVGVLAGLGLDQVEDAVKEMQLNRGAKTLVATMSANGAKTVLVTGGFTEFARHAADLTGFHKFYANHLDRRGAVLSGKVEEPLVDKHRKLWVLQASCREYGIDASDVLAIGDGANDLLMLEAAGLGIGYQPKDRLRAALPNHIIHGDLSAALYAQGLTGERIRDLSSKMAA